MCDIEDFFSRCKGMKKSEQRRIFSLLLHKNLTLEQTRWSRYAYRHRCRTNTIEFDTETQRHRVIFVFCTRPLRLSVFVFNM